MQKLVYLILVITLIPIASALSGNDSSGNEIRFADGYLTINSTGSTVGTQGFGDENSAKVTGDNIVGWLSQLVYNKFSPENVSLHSPPNNSYLNHTPTFEWSNTTDTEKFEISYLFEIYNDSALTEINFVNHTIAETANTTSTLPDINFTDSTFYWIVIANDTDFNSTSSVINVFTIDQTLPTVFNLTSPEDEASSTDTTPTLTWQLTTDTNFDNYTIEISTLSDFSTT